MRQWPAAFAACAILAFSCTARAAAERASPPERWLFNVGLGHSRIGYPDYESHIVDILKRTDGVRNYPIYVDLGMYGPRRDIWLVGMAVNGIADRYAYTGGWLQLTQVTFGLSGVRFFGGEVGRGLFLRGDGGISFLHVQEKNGLNDTTESGLGMLVGGGWSFPLEPGTWFVVNAGLQIRRVEGEITRAVTLGAGFML